MDVLVGSRRWVQKLFLGRGHDASIAGELAKKFCEANNLDEPRTGWSENLVHPDVLRARYAESGKWYDIPKWGKALCCGTTGGDFLMSFAIRVEGTTCLRFLNDEWIRESEVQSW